MDIRYGCSPKDYPRYTTEELREEFYIKGLYQADKVVPVYSHADRMVTVGIMPVTKALSIADGLDIMANFGTSYFLERREAGIFNLGGKGRIVADGEPFAMDYKDCIYLAMGTKEVSFSSETLEEPAKFYLVSAPAHKRHKTTFISAEQAAKKPLGNTESANKRVINQYIHPDVLETCQLCMGLTVLEPGSVWNTMPVHTHERRMEVYTYFELPGDNVVFHLMGTGEETRHIVMGNEDAVISPSWSIHAGCGTTSYSFIWAMGGENQAFDDMDGIETTTLQ